jgi:hypothetical protein
MLARSTDVEIGRLVAFEARLSMELMNRRKALIEAVLPRKAWNTPN